MKRWLVAIGISIGAAGGWFALLHTDRLRPDPAGFALAQIAIIAALAVAVLIVLSTAACERWFLPQHPLPALALAALFWAIACVAATILVFHEFFGTISLLFAFHAVFIIVPMLVFLGSCALLRKPNKSPETNALTQP